MSRGKKRKHGTDSLSDNRTVASSKNYTPVQKDLLLPHYPLVRTLRQHVLASLPDSSKVRRKKIAALGSAIGASELEAQLSNLLDTALVGCNPPAPRSESEESTWRQWLYFSQKGDESYVTISNGVASSIDQQSEVGFRLPNAIGRTGEAKWPNCRFLTLSSGGYSAERGLGHGPNTCFVTAFVKVPEMINLPGQPSPEYTANIPISASRP